MLLGIDTRLPSGRDPSIEYFKFFFRGEDDERERMKRDKKKEINTLLDFV